jgi:protein-L-isoaspartate(D-aspartate) O-methyltransferase
VGATFERQARSAGVRDPRVLAALAAVPREAFVPPQYGPDAGVDAPIPLPLGQTTSQPSLIGLMVEALGLTGTERVLEVGTGYGYQAAVLSRLAGEVWSVEWFDPLAQAARRALSAHGAQNVTVVVGDGRLGLPERAPFDAVVVAAQADDVPAPLVEQLVEGGRLVLPLGGPGYQEAVVLVRRGDRAHRVASLGGVRFVPLLRPGGSWSA